MKGWFAELTTLKRTGFYHIFSSQVFERVVLFCNNVLIVRLVSKTDFGVYTYAQNIIAIFLLLNGLGAVSGLLQFGSENQNDLQKQAAFTKYAWRFGLSASIGLSLLTIIYTQVIEAKVEGAAGILLLLSLRPITQYIISQIQIGFRIRLQNKIFSAMNVLSSSITLVCTVLGAYFWGIYGVVLLQYLGNLGFIGLGFAFTKRFGQHPDTAIQLSQKEKRGFVKLSVVSCISNTVSQMLYLLDVYIIGVLIADPDVIATYKTATTIPFAMTFVPLAIMTYIYPYFASHHQDRGWVRAKYYQMVKRLVVINGVITAGMYVFAPWIIRYVFGANYMDAVQPFRILSLGYFIAATFRIPSGNILVSLHKVTFNLYNALISGGANVVFSLVLISTFGPLGAAYSTVAVYILSSFISTVYLNRLINRPAGGGSPEIEFSEAGVKG
ncbi:MAG TPA: oligosaccharide flippase family protein [Anaerolineaceae bacterium]|nr:oligosaccharide flippase family protein [Anaerolineaceae bacterium]